MGGSHVPVRAAHLFYYPIAADINPHDGLIHTVSLTEKGGKPGKMFHKKSAPVRWNRSVLYH